MYNSYRDRKHVAEIKSWAKSLKYGVAGTLTFKPRIGSGEYITDAEARATLFEYFRRLNRLAYGSASRVNRGDRKVEFVAVAEGSCLYSFDEERRRHYHIAVGIPDGFEFGMWAKLCEREWLRLSWAGLHSTFNRQFDDGWVDYMFKQSTKVDYLDALDLDAFHIETPIRLK